MVQKIIAYIGLFKSWTTKGIQKRLNVTWVLSSNMVLKICAYIALLYWMLPLPGHNCPKESVGVWVTFVVYFNHHPMY